MSRMDKYLKFPQISFLWQLQMFDVIKFNKVQLTIPLMLLIFLRLLRTIVLQDPIVPTKTLSMRKKYWKVKKACFDQQGIQWIDLNMIWCPKLLRWRYLFFYSKLWSHEIRAFWNLSSYMEFYNIVWTTNCTVGHLDTCATTSMSKSR